MKGYLILFLSAISLIALGQNPEGVNSPANQKAFEYFQAQQYHDVLSLVSTKKTLTPDEKIMLELSRLKTGEDSSEEIKTWIKEEKNHPFQSLARFKYAEHAFYSGDSTVSKSLLQSIRYKDLSTEDLASYGFIYGVLQLQSGNYKNASNLFNHARKNGFNKESQLTYYQAFTSYHLNDLESALKGFEQSVQNEEYALSSRFFLAKIQLEQGEHEEVIKLAQSEISEEKSTTNSGFHQLIGESYALLGNVTKADAYFEQAIKVHPDRPGPALYYQAGVSKFKIGNVDKALVFLKEAGIGSGPYAKLSAFQLGRLYVKRKEWENALTAYIEASSSSDPLIKEESLFHAAKLNAQLGRYTDAINYSDDYLGGFPSGQWKDEIQNLLAQSYLKTSNYDLAINHLEQIGLVNDLQKEVYQKVTYQKAIQLFNDADFTSSLMFFRKSLQYQINKSLVNDSYFHSGEILLRGESYDQAIISYQQQVPVSAEAHYGIGYAYYNQQNYERAISHFQRALAGQPEIKQDAKLRLADCYYATKSYQEALETYTLLPASDYTAYQSGLVLKNLGKENDAINSFGKVSASSGLRDNAEFNIAQTYFEQASFEQAEAGFTSLIATFPASSFLPKAYLNRAISRSNLQKYDMARADYEYVISSYIQREEAFDAILGLQELQQRGVKAGNLDKYIAAYKKANPDDSSLEVVEFEEAKSSYFDLDYQNAISKLDAFLSAYPQSRYKAEAEYYLGDAYYRSEQLVEAREVFDQQKYVRNVFTGRILGRLGTVNYLLKSYDESIEAFTLLKDLNLSERDRYNAMEGLLNAYFDSGQYNDAIEESNAILGLEWKPLNAEQKTRFIKARSLESLERLDEATQEYSSLSEGSDAIAAESSYRLALIQYSQGNYDQSLDKLFELNSKFGSYAEWVNQSYLLIADNYIKKEELFQAKATLRSIIQHSQDINIKAEAQQKLVMIEQGTETDSTKTEGQ